MILLAFPIISVARDSIAWVEWFDASRVHPHMSYLFVLHRSLYLPKPISGIKRFTSYAIVLKQWTPSSVSAIARHLPVSLLLWKRPFIGYIIFCIWLDSCGWVLISSLIVSYKIRVFSDYDKSVIVAWLSSHLSSHSFAPSSTFTPNIVNSSVKCIGRSQLPKSTQNWW